MLSSHASDSPGIPKRLKGNHYYAEDTAEDKNLFSKILRQQGSDFIRLDLGFSNDPNINSGEMALQLLRTFIRWNISNPENPF